MFDIGISHLVVMAIVGILVLGPEKLPGFIKDVVRMWRTVRTLATDTQAKITGELLPDLLHEVRAMSPRRIVEHVLLDDTNDQDNSRKERAA